MIELLKKANGQDQLIILILNLFIKSNQDPESLAKVEIREIQYLKENLIKVGIKGKHKVQVKTKA